MIRFKKRRLTIAESALTIGLTALAFAGLRTSEFGALLPMIAAFGLLTLVVVSSLVYLPAGVDEVALLVVFLTLSVIACSPIVSR